MRIIGCYIITHPFIVRKSKIQFNYRFEDKKNWYIFLKYYSISA